ncbi:MAG: MFS transporter [Acidimicrobiia bacterium]
MSFRPMRRAGHGIAPGWLNRGVGGIGVASLLSDLSHEIPTALLPNLVTQTLGAPASALGLIEGVSDGLAGAAKLAGGPLADEPSRRGPVAVGGYTTTAVLSSAVGAATSVVHVGLLRAGAWAARGLRVPARNALLADMVDADRYGHAYGFERAMDNLGAVGGPLLAIALAAAVGTRSAILLSLIPGLGAALSMAYAVRHVPKPTKRPRTPIRLRVRPVIESGLGPLLTAIGAFEIGNVAATLMILRATELLTASHGPERAATIALLLYAGYNLAAALSSVPAGRLADHRTPHLVLTLGVAAFAVSYAGFTRDTSSWAVLLPWFALAGIGIGAVETSEHAIVARKADQAIRGTAFGLLAALQSLGNFAASVVAGILWTGVGPQWAFAYLTGWMVISLLLLGRRAARV